jgi:hypothetical protein
VISILPEKMTAENKSANAVGNFFKEQKIGQALRQSNFSKQKSFPCKDLLWTSPGYQDTNLSNF